MHDLSANIPFKITSKMDNNTLLDEPPAILADACALKKEDNFFFPRCSTPVFDRCVGSRPVLYVPNEDSGFGSSGKWAEYSEWKKRLQCPKQELFKVRGPSSDQNRVFNLQLRLESCGVKNCSIISGYFESYPTIQTNAGESIVKPEPLYQMWFPITYPSYWTTTSCSYPNQIWYEMHVQQPRLQPVVAPQLPPFWSPAANCFLQEQNLPGNLYVNTAASYNYMQTQQIQNQCTAPPSYQGNVGISGQFMYTSYYAPPNSPPPQLRHLYYQYPAFMTYPSSQPVPAPAPVSMGVPVTNCFNVPSMHAVGNTYHGNANLFSAAVMTSS